MLQYEFLQRALAAAALTGLLCGALGFFVILRRLAFIGVGISHASLGGVAIGVLLGIDPFVTAGAVAVLTALGIGGLGRRGPLTEDALIGVLLSSAMALGIVLIGFKRGYRQELFGYLFGSVLTISGSELLVLALASAAILAVLFFLFPALLFLAFDEEIARAYGHRVDRLNMLLLVLLAGTVLLGIRSVGILLVEALLVIPAATAALWTTNFRHQIPLASTLGAACGVLGLVASYHLDLAAGGAIVLLLSGAFFVSLLLRRPG